jgi:hypothetical protein
MKRFSMAMFTVPGDTIIKAEGSRHKAERRFLVKR